MSLTRRLNFYNGFFTYAEDWNEEQSYHLERGRHHRQSFHTPGVAWGLEVRPKDEDLNEPEKPKPFGVTIEAGAALDGLGHDLIVASETFYDLAPYLPPTGSKLVYLCLKAHSQPREEDQNNRGKYKRWEDTVDVEVREQLDPANACVEIARMQLYAGAEHLCDNDVDTRHRLLAGSLGVPVRKLLVYPETVFLREALRLTRESFYLLQEKLQLVLIADVRSAALSIEMLLRSDGIAYHTALPLLKVLAELQDQVAEDIARHFPNDTPFDPFRNYRLAVNKLLESVKRIKTLTHEQQEDFKTLTDTLCEVAYCAKVLAGITVADAGADQYNLKSRTPVQLHGALSCAGVGRKIEGYKWKVTAFNGREPSKPFESTVPAPVHTIVEGLAPGKYVFQLTIIDDKMHESSPDTMIITVQDVKPLADAGENFWVYEGDDAWLNASLSIDPDGGKIAYYKWNETECPGPERVPQITTTRPHYNAGGRLAKGKHVFQLVVLDAEGTASEPATVTVEVRAKA